MPVDSRALASTLQTLLSSVDLPEQVGQEALIVRLDRVLAAADEVLNVDGVGLMLHGRDDALRVVGTSDAASEALERGQQQLNLGPALDCVGRDATIAVRDLAEAGDYRPLWDLLAADDPNSLMHAVLSAPVRVAGRVVGTLNVFRAEPQEWPPDEVRAVEAYAGILGVLLRLGSWQRGPEEADRDRGK